MFCRVILPLDRVCRAIKKLLHYALPSSRGDPPLSRGSLCVVLLLDGLPSPGRPEVTANQADKSSVCLGGHLMKGRKGTR